MADHLVTAQSLLQYVQKSGLTFSGAVLIVAMGILLWRMFLRQVSTTTQIYNTAWRKRKK